MTGGSAPPVVFRAGTATNGGASAVSSLTMNTPAGTALGDLLIAALTWTAGSVTPSTPSGWTEIGTLTIGAGTNGVLYSKSAGASEPSSYTFSFSGGTAYICGIELAYEGALVDAIAVNTSSSSKVSSWAAPSVTTSLPRERVVGIWGLTQVTSPFGGLAAPGTATQRELADAVDGSSAATQVIAADYTGPQNAGATLPGSATTSESSGYFAAASVTLKPAL